jgi:hypothetical protein
MGNKGVRAFLGLEKYVLDDIIRGILFFPAE